MAHIQVYRRWASGHWLVCGSWPVSGYAIGVPAARRLADPASYTRSAYRTCLEKQKNNKQTERRVMTKETKCLRSTIEQMARGMYAVRSTGERI